YRIHDEGITQKHYNWKMHYLDIFNYTEAIHILLDRKYGLIIKSIKLRLWLDYKLRNTKNPVTIFLYRGLSYVNYVIKRRIL
ncbi:MAG: hypothetical protein RLZZ546_955, partial [Bacteroidota bacterium]